MYIGNDTIIHKSCCLLATLYQVLLSSDWSSAVLSDLNQTITVVIQNQTKTCKFDCVLWMCVAVLCQSCPVSGLSCVRGVSVPVLVHFVRKLRHLKTSWLHIPKRKFAYLHHYNYFTCTTWWQRISQELICHLVTQLGTDAPPGDSTGNCCATWWLNWELLCHLVTQLGTVAPPGDSAENWCTTSWLSWKLLRHLVTQLGTDATPGNTAENWCTTWWLSWELLHHLVTQLGTVAPPCDSAGNWCNTW